MKKTIKTSEVLKVYDILRNTKFTKMEDADQIKVWKICRALKPISDKREEEAQNAAKTFKPTNEGFEKDLENAQSVERMIRFPNVKVEDLPMSAAAYNKFIVEVMNPYNKKVADALKEYDDKDVEVEFEHIGEDAFAKFLASNELTGEQIAIVGDFIV